MVFVIGAFCFMAFLVGGIPFGYLVGRAMLKDDIRKHGSGNIGATNVARLLGWKWGFVVLFLDASRGCCRHWRQSCFCRIRGSEELVNLGAILAGICCIVGHMYPIWLKLRAERVSRRHWASSWLSRPWLREWHWRRFCSCLP